MKTRAAVLYEANTPLVVETLDLDEPAAGEVLVKIAAAGVCASDYHVMTGDWTMPLPMVLGHEAAGVVERVGPGCTRVKPGDHVILNFRANCGGCHACTVGRPVLCDGVDSLRWYMFDGSVRLHRGKDPVHHFSRTASFSEFAVVPESGAVPVRKDMPLGPASLISCAVMTGVGAVTNTAKIEPGSVVAVIGCGGVGLSCVQGARLAGASRIIAVDMLDNKLDYARSMGATDAVNAGSADAVGEVLEMTHGGVDYAFEAIGKAACIRQAFDMLRPGGLAVVVGMTAETEEVSVNALKIPRTETGIIGSWFGSARPWVDLPKMADLYMDGRLQLDEMISRTYTLEQINEAYGALAAGEVARSVIEF